MQISLYIYGFKTLKTYDINNYNLKLENKTYLSVIIPIKNEAKNLISLINNLKNQSLNNTYFEVFFINDHSSDKSEQIVNGLIKGVKQFKLINLTLSQKGKKRHHPESN